MKLKKIVSGALASALALSLAVPAFAAGTVDRPLAESAESSFEIELEGMIYTPTIRVQVSETGSVYVNPSESVVAGTVVKALDGKDNLDYSFDGQGVISTPIVIRSDTDKALTVSATATATVPTTSKIILTKTSTLTTKTDNSVYLTVTGSETPLGDAATIKTAKGITEASLATPGTNAKLEPAADGKTAELATAIEVAKINKATQVTDPTTGKVTSVTPQYGVVAVTGTAAGKSTWTENDVVNVALVLTFGIESETT